MTRECPTCEGNGVLPDPRPPFSLDTPPDYWTVPCRRCNGTGLLTTEGQR